MSEDTVTRRTLLKAGAMTLAGALAGTAFAAPEEGAERRLARRAREDKKKPEPQPVELTEEQVKAISQLVQDLQSPDAAVRMKAAQGAEAVGWIAIPSLQQLAIHRDQNVRKAMEIALNDIVLHAARPGAEAEREAANDQLIAWVLSGNSLEAQRLGVQQLQYVGTDKAVPVLERSIMAPQLREDSRMSLEAIPGRAATRSLERLRKRVPEEYRDEIEESLRRRRETMKTVGVKEGDRRR